MNEKVDKQIEKLVERSMKMQSLESPSLDFTKTVMQKVNAIEQSTVITYKPLISKPAWFTILAVTITIVLYSAFGTSNFETGWLNSIDLSVITNNKLSNSLAGLEVSKTVMYGVVLFGIMLFIQVPILKNYFDKRLAV